MKTVLLTLAPDHFPDTPIKIDPSHGFAVAAFFKAGQPVADRCEVFTTFGTFTVRGTVEEVSAALEAAGAPAVIDCADRAAMLCDALTRTADAGVKLPDWYEIDRVLGISPDDSTWPDTACALRDLAARLRESRARQEAR